MRALQEFFTDTPVNQITLTTIEDYKAWRAKEKSYRKKKITPGTINRELSVLFRMFERLIDDEKIEKNPVKKVKKEKEGEPRDRVLSREEYQRLLAAADDYLKPILEVAYGTGMRKQEILKLKRDRVDFQAGFIRLRPEDTKTREGRNVPIDNNLLQTLRTVILRGSKDHGYVFTRYGTPIGDIRKAFASACKAAKIDGFVFHDFRHTWITNKRREGHDYFKIMAASGHRTMEVFKRYNTVDEADLRSLVGENGHQNGHQAAHPEQASSTTNDATFQNIIEIHLAGD